LSRIYVASSWRNPYQQDIVRDLRAHGHQVYDFRNPPFATGFAWKDIDLSVPCTAGAYRMALQTSPRAAQGFNSDFAAMRWADVGLLVLPCGRSAHLELGWMAGAGKRTLIRRAAPGRQRIMSDPVTILYERCPDCDSAARWNYGPQTCDACGRGKPALDFTALTIGALDVLRERRRQVNAEGFDDGHDDSHVRGEMAQAAACYAAFGSTPVLMRLAQPTISERYAERTRFLRWPWSIAWWKPRDRRSNLVRSAALAIAEIDRLDREATRNETAMREGAADALDDAVEAAADIARSAGRTE
jgi:hypothetical protein